MPPGGRGHADCGRGHLERSAAALLRLLTSCIDDAAISLSLFENATGATTPEFSHEKWDAERQQESEIRLRLENEVPLGLSVEQRWEAINRIHDLARIEAKQARWRAGEIPSSYLHRLPFIHAKSFLYALDSLKKSLALIAEKPNAPEGVAVALIAFGDAFPQLTDLRNSAHHVEDRVQGRPEGRSA